jgi:hypothetical protein
MAKDEEIKHTFKNQRTIWAKNVLPKLNGPLFTELPFEIRLMIYREVIDSWGRGRVHIFSVGSPFDQRQKPQRPLLTSVPCIQRHKEEEDKTGHIMAHHPYWHIAEVYGYTRLPRFEYQPLSIFLSCKQM